MARSNNLRSGQWTSNGHQIHNSRGQSTLACSQHIARTLGTFRAARYLHKRGWSLEAALWVLCRSERTRSDVMGSES